jgi:putative sigma-54 modulation protein
MILHFKSKNITISDAVELHFAKKLKRMEKYLGREAEAIISCVREKGQDRLEITLMAKGLEIRAEDTAADLYSALDLVCDRLERQIERFKTRMEQKKNQRESIRHGAMIMPQYAIDHSDIDETNDEPRIVRSKQVALQPLDPEEACMQMELLGHSFFVFLNAHSEVVNVVYRRKDGNYGLIEPE